MRKTALYKGPVTSVAVLLFTLSSLASFSQGVGINDDGSVPNSRAMLDVDKAGKGMLIPRMTKADRDTITAIPTSLLIYQTDDTTGYYYYTGSEWIRLETAKHMAKMSRSTTQSITDGAWTQINFTAEDYDVGNIADISTEKITVKRTGVYLVIGKVDLEGAIDDARRLQAAIYKNGVKVCVARNEASSTTTVLSTVLTTLSLTAGDYIELYVEHNHGVGNTTSADNGKATELSVVQLF